MSTKHDFLLHACPFDLKSILAAWLLFKSTREDDPFRFQLLGAKPWLNRPLNGSELVTEVEKLSDADDNTDVVEMGYIGHPVVDKHKSNPARKWTCGKLPLTIEEVIHITADPSSLATKTTTADAVDSLLGMFNADPFCDLTTRMGFPLVSLILLKNHSLLKDTGIGKSHLLRTWIVHEYYLMYEYLPEDLIRALYPIMERLDTLYPELELRCGLEFDERDDEVNDKHMAYMFRAIMTLHALVSFSKVENIIRYLNTIMALNSDGVDRLLEPYGDIFVNQVKSGIMTQGYTAEGDTVMNLASWFAYINAKPYLLLDNLWTVVAHDHTLHKTIRYNNNSLNPEFTITED